MNVNWKKWYAALLNPYHVFVNYLAIMFIFVPCEYNHITKGKNCWQACFRPWFLFKVWAESIHAWACNISRVLNTFLIFTLWISHSRRAHYLEKVMCWTPWTMSSVFYSSRGCTTLIIHGRAPTACRRYAMRFKCSTYD